MNFGLIVGNRGFFPADLCDAGRILVIDALRKLKHNVITLSTEDSRHGAVESLDEAQKCAKMFKLCADQIDGIIVTLPNFAMNEPLPTQSVWLVSMYQSWCMHLTTTQTS